MSDGDRSKDYRPIIHLIGGSVCLAVFSVLIWTWSANYTHNQIQAEQYAQYYEEEAVDEAQKACAFSDPAKRIKCETEIVQRTREAEHDAHDLNAQRDSAYWGSWSVFLAAINALITLIGIFFVWRSLKLNRDAVEAAVHANAVAREMGEAQVRAYLEVGGAVVKYQGDRAEPNITINVTNTGQSPARNVTVCYRVAVETDDAGAPIYTDEAVHSRLLTHALGGGTTEGLEFVAFQAAAYPDAGVQMPTGHFFILEGVIEYDTIFTPSNGQTDRRTIFTLVYSGPLRWSHAYTESPQLPMKQFHGAMPAWFENYASIRGYDDAKRHKAKDQ